MTKSVDSLIDELVNDYLSKNSSLTKLEISHKIKDLKLKDFQVKSLFKERIPQELFDPELFNSYCLRVLGTPRYSLKYINNKGEYVQLRINYKVPIFDTVKEAEVVGRRYNGWGVIEHK